MVNPMPVAPVFTNMAMFTSPIMAAENQTAVGAAGFFAATGAVSYSLTGAEMTRLTITNAGTLTFNTAPNFEMPRGFPLGGTNTNTYTIGITARSSAGLTTQSGTITIQVTDVNEAPLFPGFAPPTFTEYSTGTFDPRRHRCGRRANADLQPSPAPPTAPPSPATPSPGRRGKMTAAC